MTESRIAAYIERKYVLESAEIYLECKVLPICILQKMFYKNGQLYVAIIKSDAARQTVA